MDSFLSVSSFTGKEEANKIKFIHLSRENVFLSQTVQELREQILSLRNINQQLQESLPNNTKAIINELTEQNSKLQQSLFRVMKKNEELSCDTLMKSQLICENQNENQEILTSYEQKIYQLRMQVQSKENLIKKIEDKYVKDKQEEYGSISEVNLLYFDELNELRIVIESVNAENLYLKNLNLQKQEEISKMKNQLIQYQNLLKNVNDPENLKYSVISNLNTDRTEDKKTDYTINPCEQLKRLDLKAKMLNHSNSEFFPLEANKNKVISNQLYQENQALRNQNEKLLKDIANKSKQCRTLQYAYQKITSEMQKYQLELQLYRNNFHESTKVITQRQKENKQFKKQGIFFKKGLSEKEDTINYWKAWTNLYGNSQNVDGRRVLCVSSQKNKTKRSLSSIAKFQYTQAPTKTLIYFARDIDDQILSFNTEAQNQNGVSQNCPKKSNNDKGIFGEDISSIIKPTKGMKNLRRKQFLQMDIDIEY